MLLISSHLFVLGTALYCYKPCIRHLLGGHVVNARQILPQ